MGDDIITGLERQALTPRGIALARIQMLEENQHDNNNDNESASSSSPSSSFASLFVSHLEQAFGSFEPLLTQRRNQKNKDDCYYGHQDDGVGRSSTTDRSSNTKGERLRHWPETRLLQRFLDVHLKINQLDPILAEELAREGSHRLVSRILKLDVLPDPMDNNNNDDNNNNNNNNNDTDDSDNIGAVDDYDALIELQDLAGQVGASSSIGFPLPTAPYDCQTLQSRLPLFFSTKSKIDPRRPVVDDDDDDNCCDPNATTPNDTSTNDNNDGIFIHQVTARQSEQRDVGFLMWPSAVALAQWLIQNATILRGKSVLELGAGCGLTGLVCAQLQQRFKRKKQGNCDAPRILLTDFNPQVLENLQRNIALNDLADEASVVGLDFYQQVGPSSSSLSSSSSSSWIDLNGITREPVDVVLGADIICQPEDARAAAKAIHDCLVPGGQAILISASAKHRFGVDHLQDACSTVGLLVRSVEPVDRQVLFHGHPYHDRRGVVVLQDLKKTAGFVDDMGLILFRIEKKKY
jgi:predicted nicotinamide N-methyase